MCGQADYGVLGEKLSMDKFWKLIDKLMYFFITKLFRIELKPETWEKLQQFVKFGVVGLSNTLISYVVYVVLVFMGVYYLLASLIGFVVSVLNAYYWNNKYVFQTDVGESRVWWKILIKTFASYAGTGLVLSNILLILWVEVLHLPEIIAPLINLIVTIPLNFVLNKYWAFKKQENK